VFCCLWLQYPRHPRRVVVNKNFCLTCQGRPFCAS
jgi:hypothetical protein